MATRTHYTVTFEVSKQDRDLITKIARRAVPLYRNAGVKRDVINVQMDITACHANGCPLRLAELLAADDFQFMHDVAGIARHLDHATGALRHCFAPRFAVRQSETTA